jgi:photosystem II stability/assembly factor-like uncharacterized protein
MKKIITFFAALLFAGISYSQPWQEQVSGVTSQLTSISVIDNLNGWICGYNGVVLRTTNTGTNWLNVSGNGIPATIQLINIFGISQSSAITAGYIGSNTWVYGTTNAGANWTQVFTQTGGFINAVHIRLDGTGFMMGDPVGGRWSLWRTTNSGANWDSTGLYLAQAGSEAGYNNCLSVAGSRIWFGTNNSRIYNTTNNGSGWVIQNVSPYTSITSIWFDENGSPTGYCGGDSILKTTNHGANWFSIGGPGTGLIVGVAGLTMWGGNLWYVRSGSPNIYFGFGNGQWFTDNTAPAGTYRHVTTDRIPNFPFLAFAVRTNGGISHKLVFVQGIKMIEGNIPEKFKLEQNYPNPFNPTANIEFQIPKLGLAKLTVFDVLGREIEALLNEELNPGSYEVSWDASGYPSGVYFYKLVSGDFSETKKMIFIK